MIKQTFYNLPQEKQNRIHRAIKEEFDISSFEKISINRIVKNAKISRGSFYQYFDDKSDIYTIAMQQASKHIVSMIVNCLHESNGNIFEAFLGMFDKIVECESNSEKKHFLNISRTTSSIRPLNLHNSQKFITFDDVDKVKQNIDKTDLNIYDDTDLNIILDTLILVMKATLMNIYVSGKSYEDARSDYKRRLLLLQKGFVKRKI